MLGVGQVSNDLIIGIEERHRQLKCFYDLSDFRSRSFNAIAAQVVLILLTYTLRQWQICGGKNAPGQPIVETRC
jgi:hypothetical protein